MTRTHKSLKLSASLCCCIPIRPILLVLEAHRHGRFICFLEVNQNMSGLCPPPTLVIISRTCQRCVIIRSCTLVYANIFTSYPTVFKIFTNNNMGQLRRLPPLHIAEENSCKQYSL